MSLAETAAALSQPTEQRQGWEAEGGRGNAHGGGPMPSPTLLHCLHGHELAYLPFSHTNPP